MRDFFRGAITGDNYLLLAVVKMIECVEKFFLCPFFSRKIMNIIHQEHIYISVFLAKGKYFPVLKMVNQVVHKLFGCYV
ncbi:hypothetical protein ES703_99863 [subsurface metagenome]